MTERVDLPQPPAPTDEDLWAKTTWEGHAQWQLERTLAATPEQRLAWLEAAIRIAHAAGAIRRCPAEPAPVEDPRAAST